MVMKAISIHGVSDFQAFCIFFDHATGAFDPGRGCVGLPGLKTQLGLEALSWLFQARRADTTTGAHGDEGDFNPWCVGLPGLLYLL